MWIRRKVKHGHQFGRLLGHPTLNFNVGHFKVTHQPGVYNCEVRIHRKTYKGALYFGPKLNKSGQALEVYVIDFAGDLYGHYVDFRPGKKIRESKKFDSPEELKNQIKKDIGNIV